MKIYQMPKTPHTHANQNFFSGTEKKKRFFKPTNLIPKVNDYDEPLFDQEKSRFIFNILENTTYFALSFFLGRTHLAFSVFPCGTALILASQKNFIASFFGAFLACLTYENFAVTYAALNILSLMIRFFMPFPKKQSARFTAVSATSFILAAIISVTLAVNDDFSLKSIFTSSLFIISLPFFTILFLRLEKRRLKRKRTLTLDGTFFAFTCLVAHSLKGYSFGILKFELVFAFLCVLFISKNAGGIFGLLSGLCLGISALGINYPPDFAVALAISGFISGTIFEKIGSVILPVLAFFSSFCATYYLFNQNTTTFITNCFISSILFLPLWEFLPKTQSTFTRRNFYTNYSKIPSYTDKLSGALSCVSQITYNVSNKLKYPSELEVKEIVLDILKDECKNCENVRMCKNNLLCNNKKAADIIASRLCSGGFIPQDFPEGCGENCRELQSISEKLNDAYSKLIYQRFHDNKIEILASEYSSMARLIKYTSQKTQSDTMPDKNLLNLANSALSAVGIRFSHVEAFGEREKVILVHGAITKSFPCTSSELSAYLSEKCGMLFEEPEFIGLGEKSVVRFRRKPIISVEYARNARAKGGGHLNGDSACFFETDENYFYALISDGMGSGRSAALTSRLTSVFIEKLLTTGTHKNVTLELLNNLLLSKNDESFATVDLLEIDLFSGEASFVKAGAAPAYILRSSKLYKIASFTPPAGIIRSFNAENTKFSLEKGDTVVMLSDGIIQSSDEVPWLCELLSTHTDSMAEMTEKIIDKARKINLRDDDMTCVAVKIL